MGNVSADIANHSYLNIEKNAHLMLFTSSMRKKCLLTCVMITHSIPMALAADAQNDVAESQQQQTAANLAKALDWRDQIIYFAIIDRFNDGDSSNNDQGFGEYDPRDHRKFSGGDLKGITQRLDYIKDLGATALWITPPVANQWWDDRVGYGGYHGYWASNFKQVDKHFGTLAEYKQLSHELHRHDMQLIQDIVVNHTGNFFTYDGQWNAEDPTQNFILNTQSPGVTKPTQSPFDRNDARKSADLKKAIYNFTPNVTDFADKSQLYRYALADLDDLNTDNPLVQETLRDSYRYWIKEVGVDAFRIDTVFYLPPEFFDDFMSSTDKKYPGMLQVAKQQGRDDFFAFGEGFAIDKPFEETQAKRIEEYAMTQEGKARLPGMINFPLYGSTLNVFAEGKPPAVLAHRIASMMRVHARPHLMPTFIDNHDVDRFLASGSEAALKQSLLLMMTLPGIPTIYYGTEQGFSQPRQAMFAAGFAAQGKDHFNKQSELYRYLQKTIALRKSHLVFSRGKPSVIASNAANAGVLAYRMDYQHQSMLVVFNTAEHPVLLADLCLPDIRSTHLTPLFSINEDALPITTDANGCLTLELPARTGHVWKIKQASLPINDSLKDDDASELSIDPIQTNQDGQINGDLELSGSSKNQQAFALVIDQDLSNPQIIMPDKNGRWQTRIKTDDMFDPAIKHNIVAWRKKTNDLSNAIDFQVNRQWQLREEVADPIGDDVGPSGNYRYPADPSWGMNRQGDIERIRIFTSGAALKVELTMRSITSLWNPANGFDHVAPIIYLQMPDGSDQGNGQTIMPQQNTMLPNGMRWHYRLRAHGWSNALFFHETASTSNEGRAVTPTAAISVDKQARTLNFTFPAKALGSPTSLDGAKIYITTWDYDGRLRPLKSESGKGHFSGGDGSKDPLILDASAVIEISDREQQR